MTTQLTNGKAGFSLPTPKEHLSSPVTRDMVRVQQKIVASAREFLGGEGFMEFLPPLIGPVTDPAVRGAKQVDIDYYGHRYKLMASVILYKQATLVGFDKIFYIAPNVRLEPPEARRRTGTSPSSTRSTSRWPVRRASRSPACWSGSSRTSCGGWSRTSRTCSKHWAATSPR